MYIIPLFMLFHFLVSWRKYIGCCHMEGHKHMAMTWLNLLTLFLYVIAIVGIVTCLVRVLCCYRKRSGKTRQNSLSGNGRESEDMERKGDEGNHSNWEIKNLTHLWWSKAPRA